MSDRIKAPFTPEQIVALTLWQRDPSVHPFTCGRDRMDGPHRLYALAMGEHDYGILTATRNGWICPVCGYTQDWAHAFMAKPPRSAR